MRLLTVGLVACAMGCGGGGSKDDGGVPDGAPTDGTIAMDGSPADVQQQQEGGNDAMTVMGSVSCGTTTCTTPMEYCCQRAGDGGFTFTCETSGGACTNAGRRRCDDKADCPMGDVCCYDENGGLLSSSCRNDCGGNRVQACKTTQECLIDGGMCAMHTCSGGGSVQTCAPIPNVCP